MKSCIIFLTINVTKSLLSLVLTTVAPRILSSELGIKISLLFSPRSTFLTKPPNASLLKLAIDEKNPIKIFSSYFSFIKFLEYNKNPFSSKKYILFII